MINSEALKQLFPSEEEISSEHRPPSPVHQRSYLVNGELKAWHGPVETVRSPVCVRGRDGSLEQVELGSYPVGGEPEAEEALAAAMAAYDEGRGVWPTMTAAHRIACMQNFTNQMIARRQEVVSLLMWEIGKSQADSEKEFDRAVDYIRATIEALKELDNSNSRWVAGVDAMCQLAFHLNSDAPSLIRSEALAISSDRVASDTPSASRWVTILDQEVFAA